MEDGRLHEGVPRAGREEVHRDGLLDRLRGGTEEGRAEDGRQVVYRHLVLRLVVRDPEALTHTSRVYVHGTKL